jgi:hypothetical protein
VQNRASPDRGTHDASIRYGYCAGGIKDRINSLADIVQHYIENYRQKASNELAYYGSSSSLSETIRLAANAILKDGKRHDHQRRIPGSALARLGRRLLAIEQNVEASKSFADLFGLIKDTAKDLKYIGELTIYDAALRIGAKLGQDPQEVYLHAGTRKGAAILGIDTARESVAPTSLPSAFKELKPYEMEDVLCIYKSDLQRLVRMGKL